VHGAGGDILWGYANMARYLDGAQPIYGIQARATDRKKEFKTLEEMAADYLAEIRSFQPSGPYYLGGYCFGGNVAYEMARQLHAAGETVGLMALLDCAPSNTGYEQVRWWRPSFPLQFARNLYYWWEDFVKLTSEQQHNLIGRKLRVLRRRIGRRLSGARQGEVIDLEEVFDINQFPPHELKLWESHLRLLLEHVSQPYAGEVTLFRTRGHPLLCSYKPDFGWGALARRGVNVQYVPGSHESIFMEPNVACLAKALQPFLAHDAVTTAKDGRIALGTPL
jgi:thioesterase domain-containing protein